MGRILGGSLAAAIAAFFFGFVFWGLLPDGREAALDPLPGGGLGASILNVGLEESGWYYYPIQPEHEEPPTTEQREAEEKELREKMEKGPMVMIGFRKEGADSMGKTMGIGFAHFFLTCLLLAALLSMASPKLGFLGRTAMVFIATVYGAIFHDLSSVIWWQMPTSYPTTNAAYHIMSGLIVAIILGAIVRPGGSGSGEAAAS